MKDLSALVAEELHQPVDARVAALAAAIAGRHPGARAVLFYGSCLRETRLDGLMLDFYLIVADYRRAYGRGWLATANRLLPPNVFPFEHNGLAAKYAMLSEADFRRLASSRTRAVAVWARFAQPSRLAWTADPAATAAAVDAVTGAAPALFAAARPCLPDEADPLDLWSSAFALTYGAELRAERRTRSASVVEADPARYGRFTLPALAAAGLNAAGQGGRVHFDRRLTASQRQAGVRDWRRRARAGKALTLLRLVKASATFAGGLDYLAWKIGRHSGRPVAVQPWQRRHPVLGGLSLLPRLLVRGAVR
jgi:hypothetical protein